MRWLIFVVSITFSICVLMIYLFVIKEYNVDFLYIIGFITISITIIGILLNVIMNYNPTLQSKDLKIYNTIKDELFIVFIDSIILLALCFIYCGVSVTKCFPLELSYGISNIPGMILIGIITYFFMSIVVGFGLSIATLKMLMEESLNESHSTKKIK